MSKLKQFLLVFVTPRGELTNACDAMRSPGCFFVVLPESVGPMSSQKAITGEFEGVNYKVNHSFLAL